MGSQCYALKCLTPLATTLGTAKGALAHLLTLPEANLKGESCAAFPLQFIISFSCLSQNTISKKVNLHIWEAPCVATVASLQKNSLPIDRDVITNFEIKSQKLKMKGYGTDGVTDAINRVCHS